MFVANLFFVVLTALGQDVLEKDSVITEESKKIMVYNMAKQFNDPLGQRVALYNLLAENPNHVGLRDSLALVFLESGMYASAALVSQEVAELVPQDLFATEIAALSFEKLGVKSKALKYYERLYLNDTDDIGKLYKMAFLQVDLKKYEEALISADQLISHKLSEKTSLLFPKSDGNNQEVSVKIASLRIKSMVEKERGNEDQAIKYLEEIIVQIPDFELVKNELADLKK